MCCVSSCTAGISFSGMWPVPLSLQHRRQQNTDAAIAQRPPRRSPYAAATPPPAAPLRPAPPRLASAPVVRAPAAASRARNSDTPGREAQRRLRFGAAGSSEGRWAGPWWAGRVMGGTSAVTVKGAWRTGVQ